MENLIEPYNPAWKTQFEELKNFLLEVFSDWDIDIQHVGSTAIPGLPAKPILDIDIIIEDKLLLTELSNRLEGLGYINKGEQGIEGRFAFRQTTAKTPYKGEVREWQNHHLYVCYANSLALKNHLLFRDALLNNGELMLEYASIKLKLVKEKGMTREKYNIKKTDFIVSVLTKLGLNKSELDEIIKANI